jgi:hypothetical protein
MKNKDDVIVEVRVNRETASKEFQENPAKFTKDAKALAKKLGIKKSPLKAISIDFSRLGKKKKGDEAA